MFISPLLLLVSLSSLPVGGYWALVASAVTSFKEWPALLLLGQLSSAPLLLFFFSLLLLRFITAFPLSPYLLIHLIQTLRAIVGVFEVKGRFVPTSKYHSVLLCVFWDHGEYKHTCLASLPQLVCSFIFAISFAEHFISKSPPKLSQMTFEVLNKTIFC